MSSNALTLLARNAEPHTIHTATHQPAAPARHTRRCALSRKPQRPHLPHPEPDGTLPLPSHHRRAECGLLRHRYGPGHPASRGRMCHFGLSPCQPASSRMRSFLPAATSRSHLRRPPRSLDWTDGWPDTASARCFRFHGKNERDVAGVSRQDGGMVLQPTHQRSLAGLHAPCGWPRTPQRTAQRTAL